METTTAQLFEQGDIVKNKSTNVVGYVTGVVFSTTQTSGTIIYKVFYSPFGIIETPEFNLTLISKKEH